MLVLWTVPFVTAVRAFFWTRVAWTTIVTGLDYMVFALRYRTRVDISLWRGVGKK